MLSYEFWDVTKVKVKLQVNQRIRDSPTISMDETAPEMSVRKEAGHVCLYSPEINVILVYLGELKRRRLKYTENQANGVIISSRSYKIPFKPVVYYKHVATSPTHFLTVLFLKHCFRQTRSGCVQCVCVTHVDLN